MEITARNVMCHRSSDTDESLEIDELGQAHGETGGLELPVGWRRSTVYGRETVAPSPVAEMLKVPAVLLGAYEYACQPDGGFGIEAMNGPAVWFWPLGATPVGDARVPGTLPMWAL